VPKNLIANTQWKTVRIWYFEHKAVVSRFSFQSLSVEPPVRGVSMDNIEGVFVITLPESESKPHRSCSRTGYISTK